MVSGNLSSLQTVLLLHALAASTHVLGGKAGQPLVVNTWPFVRATETAWVALNNNAAKHAALDAVEQVLHFLTLVGLLSFVLAGKTAQICRSAGGSSTHKECIADDVYVND